MSVNLKYKHQKKTYKLMREELKRSGKVAYIYPTGCGKTFPVLKYIEDEPEKSFLIVVPTQIIRNQYKDYIKNYVTNGKELLKNKKIEIITYSKLSLLEKIASKYSPDVCILDEAHRIGADTYEPAVDKFMERNPKTEMIAISATPERTDGRNMLYEKFGENIVYEMSLTDALSGEKENEVVLASPRYIRVLSELKPIIDEYSRKIDGILDLEKKEKLRRKFERLESIVSLAPSVQNVMRAGMKKTNGKYIVYCKDSEDLLEKMERAQEIFGLVNSKIKSDYVLSKRESGERKNR